MCACMRPSALEVYLQIRQLLKKKKYAQVRRELAQEIQCEISESSLGGGQLGFLEFCDQHSIFRSHYEQHTHLGTHRKDEGEGGVRGGGGARWLVLVKGCSEEAWKKDFTISAQHIACFHEFCAGRGVRHTSICFVAACLSETTIRISHFVHDALAVLHMSVYVCACVCTCVYVSLQICMHPNTHTHTHASETHNALTPAQDINKSK